MENWSVEEKAAAFDRLAEKYYNRNFGSMKKSDTDILMFAFYIEHKSDQDAPIDDYSLAKELGIPESAVRTLKVKKELQYPRENYNWKDAFLKRIPYAKYDDRSALVKVSIDDPNVKREIEHYLEMRNLYSEYQLNAKLLQMRSDQFVEMCTDLYAEKFAQGGVLSDYGVEELEKRLKGSSAGKYLEKENPALSLTKDALKDNWKGIVKTLANKGTKLALGELLRLIPFGTSAQPAIDRLIDTLLSA